MKQLKQLVRNIIDPGRNLGHVDRHQKEKIDGEHKGQQSMDSEAQNAKCKDDNSVVGKTDDSIASKISHEKVENCTDCEERR